MDQYIYDEKNGLWYELRGDYYLPCLKLPEAVKVRIGAWGQYHPPVSERASQNCLYSSADQREVKQLSQRYRSASEKAVFSTGKSDDGSRRCHRSAQSSRPDGMGAPYE